MLPDDAGGWGRCLWMAAERPSAERRTNHETITEESTMMISEKMNKKLNEQITNEFHAAHLYLDFSCAFTDMGLEVFAAWFRHHAEEERVHGMKIFGYLHDVGGHVRLEKIKEPGNRPDSVAGLVQAALDHELKVTRQINDLVALSDEENDYATRSFLQWFVDEQVEEVKTVTDLLNLLKLADGKYFLQVEARLARMMEKPS